MSFSHHRLAAVSAALLLVAGCGGGNTGTTGGGGPTSTTVTFTFQGGTPTAVAASIGSGAYTAETLNGNSLTLTLPSGTTKFAVAYVCPAWTQPSGTGTTQVEQETVFEATTTDGTSFHQACASISSPGQEGTLSGSVDGSAIPAASSSELVILAANSDSYWGAKLGPVTAATNYSITLPNGSYRVMAAVVDSTTLPTQTMLTAAKDLGNQTAPGMVNGGSTVVLGTADEAIPEPITYNNVPSGFPAPTTSVHFAFGGAGSLWIASGATNQWPALPAAAVESGDSYQFMSETLMNSYPVEGVLATRTMSTAGPVTFNFPAPWVYGGPTAAALPTFNMNYTGFAGQTGVYDAAMLWWGVLTPNMNYINILATANYQNGSTSLAVPDLSGLSGFIAPPASGTDVSWEAAVAQISGPMSQVLPTNVNGNAVFNWGGYLEP